MSAALERLVFPAVREDRCERVKVSPERAGRLRFLAKQLVVVRPNGEATVGALCDALADGALMVRRADDPEERWFKLPAVTRPRARKVSTEHGRGCPVD